MVSFQSVWRHVGLKKGKKEDGQAEYLDIADRIDQQEVAKGPAARRTVSSIVLPESIAYSEPLLAIVQSHPALEASSPSTPQLFSHPSLEFPMQLISQTSLQSNSDSSLQCSSHSNSPQSSEQSSFQDSCPLQLNEGQQRAKRQVSGPLSPRPEPQSLILSVGNFHTVSPEPAAASCNQNRSRRAVSLDGSNCRPTRFTEHILQQRYVDLTDIFQLKKELGRGMGGVVNQCVDKRTGAAFACKRVFKSSLRCQLDVQALVTEVKAMQALAGTTGVTKLHGVYEDSESVNMVMDLCKGGDLFDRVKARGQYPEKEAAIVCSRLASVLAICHGQGIMHRDLKPENILLASASSHTDVRIGDFGSAAFFQPGERLTALVGSALYMAPCVLRHDYGPEADLWSLGVILHILLSGAPPFNGSTNKEIFRRIKAGVVPMKRAPWQHISDSAKDLVHRLLTMDTNKQLTAAEVAEHPWIVEHCGVTRPMRMDPSESPAVQDMCQEVGFDLKDPLTSQRVEEFYLLQESSNLYGEKRKVSNRVRVTHAPLKTSHIPRAHQSPTSGSPSTATVRRKERSIYNLTPAPLDTQSLAYDGALDAELSDDWLAKSRRPRQQQLSIDIPQEDEGPFPHSPSPLMSQQASERRSLCFAPGRYAMEIQPAPPSRSWQHFFTAAEDEPISPPPSRSWQHFFTAAEDEPISPPSPPSLPESPREYKSCLSRSPTPRRPALEESEEEDEDEEGCNDCTNNGAYLDINPCADPAQLHCNKELQFPTSHHQLLRYQNLDHFQLPNLHAYSHLSVR